MLALSQRCLTRLLRIPGRERVCFLSKQKYGAYRGVKTEPSRPAEPPRLHLLSPQLDRSVDVCFLVGVHSFHF